MDQTSEDQLSIYNIRPRFRIETPYSTAELANKISEGLKNDSASLKGRVIEGHALLFLPEEMQHYWSPQLTLTFEENEKSSTLIGMYGPRPAVWTMFVFFYAVVGFATIVISMLGLSYITLDKSANILWLVPVLLLVFLSIYLVSYSGKKMGREQMVILQQYVEKWTELSI